MYDVFFLTEQKGWMCSDQGFIFHTPNGGDTWIRQIAGITKLAYRIFILDDGCGWIAGNCAIIGRTSHGGYNLSWEQIHLHYPPFHADTVDIHGISFVDRKKGWLCSGRLPVYIDTLPGQGDTFYTKGQGYICFQ